MSDNVRTVLEVKDLDLSFHMKGRDVHAIRGVSFPLRENEILAIVGESGSGKSISAKTIMGILPENAQINTGEVIYHGRGSADPLKGDLLKHDFRWRQKNVNGTRIAMVFQDPMTSLNPVVRIGDQISMIIRSHENVSKQEAYSRGVDLLREVGITDPQRTMGQFPHQLSGGMRQRVVIAIALSCDPDILICDEPTTALDVTIQEKILRLIQKIQQARGLSVIFITHNMGVVSKIADFVAVMYAGKIVEIGTVVDMFYDPVHPYTWGLLCAVPDVNEKADELYTIPGTPPDLSKEIAGDPFAPRNPYALKKDLISEPPLFKISDTHYAATWLADENAPKVEKPKLLQEKIERMKQEGRAYVNS
ncbi:MAG: ABC transporter ATP-binding protein [Lachnospiraceae bacterium]|nr:ABC transporter ATP-binding protein [Lachnospiraceae bacterium]